MPTRCADPLKIRAGLSRQVRKLPASTAPLRNRRDGHPPPDSHPPSLASFLHCQHHNQTHPNSSLFSQIGTGYLWILFPSTSLPHPPTITFSRDLASKMVQISEVKNQGRDNRTSAHTHIKGLGLTLSGNADKQAAGFVGQQTAREVRHATRSFHPGRDPQLTL